MKEHKLKRQSSYTVVVLRSLRHKGCVCCGAPIRTLEESYEHWDMELAQTSEPKNQLRLDETV